MKAKRKQGEILKEVREKKGLNQTQLGELLGVRYNTISGWETGDHKIPTTRLEEICEILNIPPSYLLGEKTTSIEYFFGYPIGEKKINIKEFMPVGINNVLIKIKNKEMECLQIKRGDIAIIDTNDKNIDKDSIYAIAAEEKILLRKIKQHGNEIVIVSCDPTQCMICIYHKSEIEIIGKVVRIIKKL